MACKICFIGALNSIHFRKIVQYFKNRGYSTYIITYHPTSTGVVEDIGNKIYVPRGIPLFKKLNYFVTIFSVRKFIRKLRPDVIFAQGATGYGFVASICNVYPIILRCQGVDIQLQAFNSKFFKFLVNFNLNKATFIISVSKPMTRALLKLGISKRKILETQMGLDFKTFNSLGRKYKTTWSIICNRMLEPIYNYEVIIKAIKILKPAYPKIKVKIISDGYLKNRLKRMIDRLTLSEQFEFIDFLPNPVIANYLKKADLYISASLSDGTSMSLLEAMGTGIFPIVSKIPANQEWIKDGENGFLFNPVNETELAQKIYRAFKNVSLRKKAAKINLIKIAQHGSFEDRMKEIERVIVNYCNQ